MRQLPPMTALVAFEATARLGSATAAADELGRTHGAISKQLRSLREALGHSLFDRDGNRLKLTEPGRAFLAEISPCLDQIERAFLTARRAGQPATLVLGVSATFASRWLMPRLPRFYARHPGTQISFLMAGRTPVHGINEVDLTLTWDRLRLPITLHRFVPLGDVAFGVVHSPGYALDKTDNVWRAATRIVPDTLPSVWEDWQTLSGQQVTGGTDFPAPNTGLIIEAACNGLGVAVLERRLIEEELADERLVAPLGWQAIEGGFGAFLPGPEKDRAELWHFLDWLREEA